MKGGKDPSWWRQCEHQTSLLSFLCWSQSESNSGMGFPPQNTDTGPESVFPLSPYHSLKDQWDYFNSTLDSGDLVGVAAEGLWVLRDIKYHWCSLTRHRARVVLELWFSVDASAKTESLGFFFPTVLYCVMWNFW